MPVPEWLRGKASERSNRTAPTRGTPSDKDRAELFDITLEEVSLVDKGDCPEAHVVFFKSASAPNLTIRKVEFNDLLRASLAEQVVSQLMMYAAVLGDAVRSTLFEDEDPKAAIQRSLDQFLEAATAAVDHWASEAKDDSGKVAAPTGGDMAKMVLGAATYATSKKLHTNGGMGRMAKFTKAADVLEAANVEAKNLMGADPEAYPTLVQARAQVWKIRPDLSDAMATLSVPVDGATDQDGGPTTSVSKLAPVQKGQTALDKATRKAQDLMAANPTTYQSIEQARAQVWKTYPELADEYQSELR